MSKVSMIAPKERLLASISTSLTIAGIGYSQQLTTDGRTYSIMDDVSSWSLDPTKRAIKVILSDGETVNLIEGEWIVQIPSGEIVINPNEISDNLGTIHQLDEAFPLSEWAWLGGASLALGLFDNTTDSTIDTPDSTSVPGSINSNGTALMATGTWASLGFDNIGTGGIVGWSYTDYEFSIATSNATDASFKKLTTSQLVTPSIAQQVTSLNDNGSVTLKATGTSTGGGPMGDDFYLYNHFANEVVQIDGNSGNVQVVSDDIVVLTYASATLAANSSFDNNGNGITNYNISSSDIVTMIPDTKFSINSTAEYFIYDTSNNTWELWEEGNTQLSNSGVKAQGFGLVGLDISAVTGFNSTDITAIQFFDADDNTYQNLEILVSTATGFAIIDLDYI